MERSIISEHMVHVLERIVSVHGAPTLIGVDSGTGMTADLGDIPSPNIMHLRCYLIDPEIGNSLLFFGWVRQQAVKAQING